MRTLLVGFCHRTVTSLNGEWHYLVEQPPVGNLYTSDGKVRDNGYALNTHPNIDSGPHDAEYDFATAPTLRVPGDWNTQEPTLFRFEGVVWYERDFDFQPQPGTRTFLHISAAKLQVLCLGQSETHLRSRGRLHPIRLRGNGGPEVRQQLRRYRGRFHARGGWHSLCSIRLVELRRPHARRFGIYCHWTAQCVPEAGDWYVRNMYTEGSDQYKYHLEHYGHPSRLGYKELCAQWTC